MRRAIVVLALAVAGEARADVQLWTKAGVGHDLTDDVGVLGDLHLRFDEDVSRFQSLMPEVELRYGPAKWLRLGAGYRLQYTRDGDGDLVVRHRFHGDGSLRHDLGDVRLDYRLRFQEQVRPGANDPSRHTLRNRARVSYRGVKRWTPELGGELFHAIDDGDTIHLDSYRLIVGVAYDRKDWEVGAFYGLEVPVADTTEPTIHILGLGYYREL